MKKKKMTDDADCWKKRKCGLIRRGGEISKPEKKSYKIYLSLLFVLYTSLYEVSFLDA